MNEYTIKNVQFNSKYADNPIEIPILTFYTIDS